MHVEFLVEEPSAEAALGNIVPRILGTEVTFAIHPYQGKGDLLNQLPARLRAYSRWLPKDWSIVILVDADDQDCRSLKARLERDAQNAGLSTKSSVAAGACFQVLNRVAVEELEAWFLGDIQALHTAYPRVSLTLDKRARYRDPDAIKGGTWEALERVLQRRGYFPGGLLKILAAQAISAEMDPARNRSHSFQVFRDGVLALCSRGCIDRLDSACSGESE